MGSRCPGDVRATGPERFSWSVVVETPTSVEAYGVLVAPVGKSWRSRVLTFPHSPWTIPGGRAVLKFVGNTPQRAEEQAIRFISEHCAARGFVMRTGLDVAPAGSPSSDPTAARHRTSTAPRWPVVLPVRYGFEELNLRAVTRNVSEAGVFVQTPSPVGQGLDVVLEVTIQADPLGLRGQVAWARKEAEIGRPPGMGIQLLGPPDRFLRYVRSLPPPVGADGFGR